MGLGWDIRFAGLLQGIRDQALGAACCCRTIKTGHDRVAVSSATLSFRLPEVDDNRCACAGRAFESHVTLVLVDNLFTDG
jgi:hypothetical protein